MRTQAHDLRYSIKKLERYLWMLEASNTDADTCAEIYKEIQIKKDILFNIH